MMIYDTVLLGAHPPNRSTGNIRSRSGRSSSSSSSSSRSSGSSGGNSR